MEKTVIHAINALPGWLSIHEGQFLHKAASQVKDKDGSIVEIGSFQGKSTIYLAKTGQPVYAIDPHEGSLDHGVRTPSTLSAFKKNIRDFEVENNITLIKKTSQSAAQNWDKKIKVRLQNVIMNLVIR